MLFFLLCNIVSVNSERHIDMIQTFFVCVFLKHIILQHHNFVSVRRSGLPFIWLECGGVSQKKNSGKDDMFWPLSSSDLYLPYFFLWNYLNCKVCIINIRTSDELKKTIIQEVKWISRTTIRKEVFPNRTQD